MTSATSEEFIRLPRLRRGACEAFCPPRERDDRLARGLLDPLERAADDGAGAVLIKRYARTVDDVFDASNVRSLDALERVCAHIYALCRRAGATTSARGKRAFAMDRLRAVRQDMIVQGLTSTSECSLSSSCGGDGDDDASTRRQRAIVLVESMIRFALASGRDAEVEATSSSTGDDDVDAKQTRYAVMSENALHDEQIGKTFGMVFGMYRDASREEDANRHHGEMFSYWICLRLNDSRELARDLRTLDARVMSTPNVRFALDVHRAYVDGNFVQFFKLVESERCNYLHACALERHFSRVRIDALRSMNAANNTTPMPFDEIARLLRIDDPTDAKSLCERCSLTVDERCVSFKTSAFITPDLANIDVMYALRTQTCSIVDSKLAHGTHGVPSSVIDGDARPETDADADIIAARRAIDAARRALDASVDAISSMTLS